MGKDEMWMSPLPRCSPDGEGVPRIGDFGGIQFSHSRLGSNSTNSVFLNPGICIILA